jgi:Cft2 family RNA processing exonuclease
MHREHINVAIASAAQGGAVAIFAENLNRAQELLSDVEDVLPRENVEKVSRLNGKHAIYLHGGGSIRFISTRQSARGLSLDRAFVPITTDRDTLAAIIPSLCTSQEGVLTGY